jgi:hypothetical protein
MARIEPISLSLSHFRSLLNFSFKKYAVDRNIEIMRLFELDLTVGIVAHKDKAQLLLKKTGHHGAK